ncbi:MULTISPECIES: hypothetical protein [unclassified Mesorhizobium]|uniref:hypothetical protein n=1 Tax=unclassified Mesorhizobium TaxID=325217 RepID=UPI00112E9279|nr:MULTISPECIES: hypothetical protein [unclassified Mesorhizobium]TPM06795.1 hypothetical protein FJ939_12080 [Mesorhizobium sp. B2-3-8]TPM15322.1 hypothetical protein FJ940_14025 [Mesorhizobium sp. B2-3-7]
MNQRTDNPGTGIQGKRHGTPVKDEAEHFMVCPICGQAFDMRDLGQVFHHADEDHQPLPTDA